VRPALAGWIGKLGDRRLACLPAPGRPVPRPPSGGGEASLPPATCDSAGIQSIVCPRGVVVVFAILRRLKRRLK